MHSFRVLGFVALGAIVVAVVCFTAVDTSIDSANGCLGARAVCREHEVPAMAITYAALGTLALLVSAAFAAGWVIGMLRHPVPEEPPPRPRRIPVVTEEDL